jgi:hypothetical protein
MGEAKWRRVVEQAFEAVHETLWTTKSQGCGGMAPGAPAVDARGPLGGLEVDARPGRPGKTPGFLLRGALTRPTLSLRKFYKDFCQSARFRSCARLRCEQVEVRLTVADSV